MKKNYLLVFLSIALLISLFLSNLLHIDIAPSKNHALMMFKQNEIQRIQNIDSAKASAIRLSEVVRQNFVEQSNTATWQLAIVLAILVLQIALLGKVNRNNIR